MLLLVAGLVVIVLVILVVVFLSVRSMRAEEGADRPARSAGRDRTGRGNARRAAAGREPASRLPTEGDWLADHEPDFGETGHDQARGMLPPPRGHQHDEDPGRRVRPEKRSAARRRQRQETGSRMTGNGRDEPGADLSAGDWGGVSDEQYWAELSADKPLATTARSAPAGGAYQEAATTAAEADADPAEASGRTAPRDPAPTMAAAGAPTAQFSLPSASARQGRLPDEPPAFAGRAADAEPAASAERWIDPMGTGSVDTDPSIGIGGWQDDGWQAAAGDPAAWQAPDRDEPAARDSRAWAEDPLTSPSFSDPGSYSADSRSYRGSHTRDRGRPDQPAGGSGTSAYGHGHDPQTDPAWEGSYGSSHDDGWRDSGHGYPSGRLDPLPESAGSAAGPDGDWYSAPTSPGGTASYRQPPHASWERRETGYDDASRHDPHTDPGLRAWPDQPESARYDTSGYDTSGYGADHGRDLGSSGHYGDTGYDAADRGYGPPDQRHGGTGYGEPGYSGGESGYRPSEHGSADAGYDLPDYGRDYQRPGYDTPDADYGLPGYGSDGSRGSVGQETGYRRYPGYDSERR
jgi:hypothetical protein